MNSAEICVIASWRIEKTQNFNPRQIHFSRENNNSSNNININSITKQFSLTFLLNWFFFKQEMEWHRIRYFDNCNSFSNVNGPFEALNVIKYMECLQGFVSLWPSCSSTCESWKWNEVDKIFSLVDFYYLWIISVQSIQCFRDRVCYYSIWIYMTGCLDRVLMNVYLLWVFVNNCVCLHATIS